MNAFQPQSIQSMGELMDLAAVPFMFVTPRDGGTIIEVIQDTMVGSYRLTKDWTRLTDRTLANLQMANSYFRGELPALGEDKMHTGRQAFGQILPPSFFMETKSKAGEMVVVKDSRLLSGTIDKPVFHAMSRGIIPLLFHDYGPFDARRFVDNLQQTVCRWLMSSGFSVGISDLVTDAETSDKLRETIRAMKQKAYDRVEEARAGRMENNSIFNNEDYFERKMTDILNETINEAGRISLDQINDRTNRMINMVKSGAKGKEINVSQMIACVGQQNVDGRRVAYGFTDRTLPHYAKFDDGPDARGFVSNSFISGLTPQEVFFHAMGGREGLIDTAVRSVTYETPIIVMERGRTRYVQIGEWIDARIAAAEQAQMELFGPEQANMELCHLEDEVYIPTVDEEGRTSWGLMTAVTRHDPGRFLYEVKTRGGRHVIVAESNSLLIWDEEERKFLPKASAEVKAGDFVPVVASIEAPPTLVGHIDMTEYFPKEEYVYGTDYNRAIRLMKEAQGDRFHIPRGWWEENNGKTFTLPYTTKAKLQRALVRSAEIKDGRMYPFHATRCEAELPERFELNYDNGVFVGIYLADGCTCVPSGHVSITKEEPSVQRFVMDWFDRFAGIKSAVFREKRDLGYTTTVSGYSRLLAQFLNAFVGETCYHKYVPDVAFCAPEEFKRGILNGYFSGDGSICKSGEVNACSASKKLIDGIGMLCNQLGMFGRISLKISEKSNVTENPAPIYSIHIRGQWAEIFRDKVRLMNEPKQEQLNQARFNPMYNNYPKIKKVVMDTIVSINPIEPGTKMKLYDVTVPETLNFVTGDGLGVQDTSDTGYIQRRLVKAMEDAKVYYDQTVRNANGCILQFVYGEDGMDGTHVEVQGLPYIDMELPAMEQRYLLRPEDTDLDLHLAPGTTLTMDDFAACRRHFEQLVEDRAFFIRKVFRGNKNQRVLYPVPFERIVRNALSRAGSVGLRGQPTDLSPAYVLAAVEDLLARLVVSPRDRGQGIRFFHCLARLHLSPKPLVMEHHMPRALFDEVLAEVERAFRRAVIQPGEMVGVVAAQTIGENSTQLVLDSFHSSGTVAAVKATSGVPRFKELLSVSKHIKTPILKIHLKEDIGSVYDPAEDDTGTVIDPRVKEETKERVMRVMSALEITRLADVLESTEVYWDPPGADGLDTSVPGDDGMMEVYRNFAMLHCQRSSSPWVLRMRLSREKVHRVGLTMLDIYLRLMSAYSKNIECLFSDDNAEELVLRIRLTKEALDGVEEQDAIAALRAMEHNLVHSVLLKGMRGIRKVSMAMKTDVVYRTTGPAPDRFQKRAEWVIDTDGTNLQEVLANPNVDATRTRSNDIWEIFHALGIEAARNALRAEVLDVVGEDSMNYRHLSLLLDTMTNRGTLMSIDRHGINRGDVGPLAKSSFEETTEMLLKASIFSEYDSISGVSANIMLGQLPPCGTGDNEVLLDEGRYAELLRERYGARGAPAAPDEAAEIIDMAPGPGDTDACGYEAIAFRFDMPQENRCAAREMPRVSVRLTEDS